MSELYYETCTSIDFEEMKYLAILQSEIRNNPFMFRDFIYDAMETGVLKIESNNYILNNQSVDVIKGFIFENAIVDIANQYDEIKKELFLRVTKHKRVSEKYLEQFKLVGTGFISTKINYPQFYQRNYTFDALFIKENNAKNITSKMLVNGNDAGIQIKSIRSDTSIREMIDDMICGKYETTVTCLQINEFKHSKERTLDILRNMTDERKRIIYDKTYTINKEVREKVKENLLSPEDIGIPQEYINYYEEFIDKLLQDKKYVIRDDVLFKCILDTLTTLQHKVMGRRINIGFELESHIQ